MTIYIDSDYKCYVSAAEGRRAIETDAFNGKCPEWIESFRFVPEGETWTRGDGGVFNGEMTASWKDLSEAYAEQAAYVTAEVEDMRAALDLLGVTNEEETA